MMLLENEDCDPHEQRFEQMLQKYDVGNPRNSDKDPKKNRNDTNKSRRYTWGLFGLEFFFITALQAFTMTKVSEPKALGEGTYGKARN